MSHEFRDLFNIEVDEFQKKAKVSNHKLQIINTTDWVLPSSRGWGLGSV